MVNLLNHADQLHNSSVPIKSRLAFGGEIHLTNGHGINRVILAETNARARKKLSAMLTNNNIAYFGSLPLREFYAKITRL